jgi:4-amino-4-deoxy-L-arabinose transferase-like glycosyltransferase
MIKYKVMEEWLKKNRTIVLFAILALAAFFRLYQITTVPPGLFSDEAVNGINTLQANETGDYKVFYPENNGREGLFINIQALSVQIFGNKPWALRGVSAIFGILTVLGLYLLTRELFKKESLALFASFFLATSYWHINFSRIGFRAIMAPFFLVWGLWLLWRLIPKEDHEDKFPDSLTQRLHSQQHLEMHRKKIISSSAIFLAGIVFGLGFHSYIAYRVMPVLLLPAFIILLKDKYFKEVIIFLLGIFIAIMPMAVYFYIHPAEFLGRTSQVSVFTSLTPLFDLGKNIVLTIGMFFAAGDFNWRHNFAGAPELWWPVAALFLFGIIIGIKKLFENCKLKIENFIKKLYLPETTLFLWIIFALAPVVVSNEGIPHALRAIIVIPAVMIFAALGLDAVLQKIPQKAAVLVFILFALVSLQTFNQYFIKWANDPNIPSAFSKDAADTANYLNSLPKETQKYVIMDSENQNAPMSINTVMFLTNTYLEKFQKEKNINYIFKKDEGLVPSGATKVWIK